MLLSTGVRLKKKVGRLNLQKTSETQLQNEPFLQYVQAALLKNVTEHQPNLNLPEVLQTAKQIQLDYQDQSILIAPFTNLQMLAQGVLESLILLDRIEYLKENTFDFEVELTPVFGAIISPRNMGIIVTNK